MPIKRFLVLISLLAITSSDEGAVEEKSFVPDLPRISGDMAEVSEAERRDHQVSQNGSASEETKVETDIGVSNEDSAGKAVEENLPPHSPRFFNGLIKTSTCLFGSCGRNYNLDRCYMCKTFTNNIMNDFCYQMGCAERAELRNKGERPQINISGNRFSKQGFCPDMCKSPKDVTIEKACKDQGCLLQNDRLKDLNPKTTICPEECKSPTDNSILKICIDIGCNKENTIKMMSTFTETRIKSNINQERTTKNISKAIAPKNQCPDHCKNEDDELKSIQCMLVGCKQLSPEKYKPKVCPDFCQHATDKTMLKICKSNKCLPDNGSKQKS